MGNTGACLVLPRATYEVVKVLNDCGVNFRYWAFVGGLTDVNVILTSPGTQTGALLTNTNPTPAGRRRGGSAPGSVLILSCRAPPMRLMT